MLKEVGMTYLPNTSGQKLSLRGGTTSAFMIKVPFRTDPDTVQVVPIHQNVSDRPPKAY